MNFFIEHPGLAAVVGALFLAGYLLSRRASNAVAGVAWLGYSAYEIAMRLRWLCTGECNIRVDLLLIYPLLLALSIAALIAFIRWRVARPRPGGSSVGAARKRGALTRRDHDANN
jgi:hypothetical protein